jgi:hypothetical protein
MKLVLYRPLFAATRGKCGADWLDDWYEALSLLFLRGRDREPTSIVSNSNKWTSTRLLFNASVTYVPR